jgi:spermidine synthase
MKKTNDPNILIFILFFLSGISGLIYEILWARILGNVFGSSTIAHSLIISLFMGGLALGSYLAGLFIRKRYITRLSMVYALIEFCIALCALISFYILPFFQNIYNNSIDISGKELFIINSARFIFILIILIIPTTLMGSTLPVISQLLIKDKISSSKLVGFLYSFNTFGAIFGIYFAGFYSILANGITNTFFIAVAINIFVSLVFFTKRNDWDLNNRANIKFNSGKDKNIISDYKKEKKHFAYILFIYAISGFTTMALEVVWIRALVFFVGSSTYAFSIILIVFLAGISIGSFVMSFVSPNLKRPILTFSFFEFILGLSSLISVLVIYHYSTATGYSAGSADPIFLSSLNSSINQIFAVVFLIAILPTLIMGAIFPVVNRIILEGSLLTGNAVGNIYSSNTIGTIFGSLSAGFILIPSFGVTGSIIFLCAINLILGFMLIFPDNPNRKQLFFYCTAIIVTALLIFIILPHNFKFKSDTETKEDKILFYKEASSATVSVFEDSKGFRSMSINGMMIGGNQIKSLRKEMMLAHLPMLLHHKPKSALIIGLGTGITLAEASLYKPDILDCVEIVDAVKDGASLFAKDNLDITRSLNAHIYIEDGRNFLATVKKKYDIIIDDSMLRRESAGNGPLYAYEYYKDISNHMNTGGIFCQWLPLYLEKDIYKSILKTAKSNFKYITLWYLGHAAVIQIASNQEIKIDIENIKDKIMIKEINERLRLVELDDIEALLKCFLLNNDEIESFCNDAAINSDDKPYVEFKVPLQNSSQVIFGENLLDMAPLRSKTIPFQFTSKTNDETINHLGKNWNNFHLILRGSILHHFDKPAESLEAYLKALEIDSTDKNAKYFLGIGRGEVNNDKANAYNKIGDYFKTKKQFDRAVYYYNRSIESEPNSLEALNSISNLYFELGNYNSAIIFGERAVSIDPGNISLLFNLGTFYEENKNYNRSKEIYKKCLELNPLFSYAKERLDKLNGMR